MSTFESTSILIAAITALINLGAVGFVGMQVRQATQQSRKAGRELETERLRQRKRDTIEAATSTSRYRQELKAALPWNDRNVDEVRAFLEKAEEDDAAKASIRAYLDHLELLAVGVNEGVLDVGTLSRMSGGRILAVEASYAGYIKRRREELKSDTVYSELELLAGLIRDHRAGQSRSNEHSSS